MSDVLEDVLTKLNKDIVGTNITGQQLGFSGVFPSVLFALYGANNQPILEVKVDGSVILGPGVAKDQASDEFFKWLQNSTNLIQVAVGAARQAERTAMAKMAEDMGSQWGILRSLKMTHWSQAAQNIADAIRKII